MQRAVTWLHNGVQTESTLVPGSNILEIEVKPNLTSRSPEKVPPQQSFNDPAILSYAKLNETKENALQSAQKKENSIPFHSNKVNTARTTPTHSLSKASVTSNPPFTSTTSHRRHLNTTLSSSTTTTETVTAATLPGPFNEILNRPSDAPSGLDTHDTNVQEPIDFTNALMPKTRGKRGGKAKMREGMTSTPTQTPVAGDLASTPVSTQQRRGNTRKGWRQTPLLEEPAPANIRLPRAHRELTSPDSGFIKGQTANHNRLAPEPRKGGRRRQKQEVEQNGWATREATDIQDMGDFDFEENHKKFDKRKVFDQIRRDDTTADEARLVSFNRLPSARPGTAGGKNLHYTENVLDSPINKNVDHSSSDSDLGLGSRSLSHTSTMRKLPSRKGSALAKASFDRIASPKLKNDSSTSQRKTSVGLPKPSLLMSASANSCPCISPLQMLELEQLAITGLDLTEDMMTENAARSIAQTAHGLASGDDPQHKPSPLVVILAGNNKTGSRAIAAGRHLRNHGTRVVLCILGLEREDDLIDSIRRQLRIFRNCGGQAIKQDALMRTLRKLQSPTNLIVDALLGMHMTFDDLRTDDQAAYFQLVCWANGSDADTLALDVPSGIDASTGKSSSHSDFRPFFKYSHSTAHLSHRRLHIPRLNPPHPHSPARPLSRRPQNRSPHRSRGNASESATEPDGRRYRYFARGVEEIRNEKEAWGGFCGELGRGGGV